jgi:hypothetical protein
VSSARRPFHRRGHPEQTKALMVPPAERVSMTKGAAAVRSFRHCRGDQDLERRHSLCSREHDFLNRGRRSA